MSVDDVFQRITRTVANKLGKKELDPNIVTTSLPLPALSTRFLFQNEGLLLGKIIHLVGEEASFKSTFSLEVLRWHLLKNGYGVVLDTEGRPIVDTCSGLIPEQYLSKFTTFQCGSLEEWQKLLTEYIKNISDDEKTIPGCFIVDSLLGCNTQNTTDDILHQGFASSRFASEARSIADFLRSYSQLLSGKFLTICLVNHRKYRLSGGFSPVLVKTSLGGNEVRFYASFELELSKSKTQKTFGQTVQYNVIFKTYKNTYGQEGIEVTCPIEFFREDDKLSINFLWHEATAQLLTEFNFKPKPADSLMKKIKNVCNVCLHSGGRRGKLYHCVELGIPENAPVSGEEISLELEKHPDILNELYKLLNITKRQLLV